MKKITFKLMSIFLMMSGTKVVQASDFSENEVARCLIELKSDTYGDQFLNSFEPGPQELIRIFNSPEETQVLIGESEKTETVVGELRFSSWVSYLLKFEYQGQQVRIFFSNFRSPSLGNIVFEDGRVEKVACELKNHI